MGSSPIVRTTDDREIMSNHTWVQDTAYVRPIDSTNPNSHYWKKKWICSICNESITEYWRGPQTWCWGIGDPVIKDKYNNIVNFGDKILIAASGRLLEGTLKRVNKGKSKISIKTDSGRISTMIYTPDKIYKLP